MCAHCRHAVCLHDLILSSMLRWSQDSSWTGRSRVHWKLFGTHVSSHFTAVCLVRVSQLASCSMHDGVDSSGRLRLARHHSMLAIPVFMASVHGV